eukprot:765606-Hanusia_phi.AAC.5
MPQGVRAAGVSEGLGNGRTGSQGSDTVSRDPLFLALGFNGAQVAELVEMSGLLQHNHAYHDRQLWIEQDRQAARVAPPLAGELISKRVVEMPRVQQLPPDMTAPLLGDQRHRQPRERGGQPRASLGSRTDRPSK